VWHCSWSLTGEGPCTSITISDMWIHLRGYRVQFPSFGYRMYWQLFRHCLKYSPHAWILFCLALVGHCYTNTAAMYREVADGQKQSDIFHLCRSCWDCNFEIFFDHSKYFASWGKRLMVIFKHFGLVICFPYFRIIFPGYFWNILPFHHTFFTTLEKLQRTF